MKKVGIVSLFNGENFGNKLQNYALQSVLEKYGFFVETFRYEIQKVEPSRKSGRKLTPNYILSYFHSKLLAAQIRSEDRCLLNRLLYLKRNGGKIAAMKQQRKQKFEEFDREALHFAEHRISLKENAGWTEDYAAFVCGSDQIWNPYYASTSSITFLQFAPEEKRIAYAPSFGVSELPENRKAEYTPWVRGIPYLSVREEAGAKLLEEMGRNSQVVADPTLLLTAQEWSDFGRAPKRAPKANSYILCYFLGRKPRRYCRYVKNKAEEKHLVVVNLFDAMSPEYQDIGPREFVYLLQNAAMVCTDSFHASVFSIIFRKSFAVFQRVEGKHSMSSRIVSLLNTFGLAAETGDIVCCEPPKDGEKILEKERNKAFNFLSCALNEAVAHE